MTKKTDQDCASLTFDGACPICRLGVKAVLVAGTGLETVAFSDEGQDIVEAHGAMKLVLPDGTVLFGADALRASLKLSPWTKLFGIVAGIPPFSFLVNALYALISGTRRLMAPSKAAWSRTAEAYDESPLKVVALVVLCVAAAVGGSILYGASLSWVRPGLTPWDAAWRLTMGAGIGWMASLPVMAVLGGRSKTSGWLWLTQPFCVMVIGVFYLLVPVAVHGVAAAYGTDLGLAVIVPFLLLDSLIMLRSTHRRLKAMEVPVRATIGWLVALEVAGCIAFYKLDLFSWGG